MYLNPRVSCPSSLQKYPRLCPVASDSKISSHSKQKTQKIESQLPIVVQIWMKFDNPERHKFSLTKLARAFQITIGMEKEIIMSIPPLPGASYSSPSSQPSRIWNYLICVMPQKNGVEYIVPRYMRQLAKFSSS